VCVCVCVYIYIYIYIYMCVCVCVCVCVCIDYIEIYIYRDTGLAFCLDVKKRERGRSWPHRQSVESRIMSM
jgi:hypothetical protein